jgi:hypothetical protein
MKYSGGGGPSRENRMVIYWGGLLLVLAMLLVAVFALTSGQAFVNQSKNHIAAISAGWDAESPMPAEPTKPPSRNLDHTPPALFVGRDATPATPWAERIRLDRASAASHDLNRLLDKPGP